MLHLSISPFGTAVSDLLGSLVPLLRDLGLQADWQIVSGDDDFGRIARLMYAGLSGRRVGWTPELETNWHRYNESNARLFEDSYDLVVAHDPQPAGLLAALPIRGASAGGCRWIWHCHLDLRDAQPEVWGVFSPVLDRYSSWVLDDLSFAPPGASARSIRAIPPAIDPAGARNMDLPTRSLEQFMDRYGIDPSRPLVAQIGSFDPTFDPLGTVEVYRRAKLQRPDLQLLLVDSIAAPSLDAWSRFERVARHASPDPDVHVLVGQGDGGDVVVNAAQRGAHVVVQRSVPAGFSIPVWESFWKARPVVAGRKGSLPLQVDDGVNGYVVQDDETFVERVLELVSDPVEAARLGAAGRRQVQERHLITRFLADELRLFGELLSGSGSADLSSTTIVSAL